MVPQSLRTEGMRWPASLRRNDCGMTKGPAANSHQALVTYPPPLN
jgi:hypothetical protein